MVIGILQFELLVPGSASLKDKRRVVKSVKDKLHREHLVSVAEVAALDHHRVAILGLSVVSNSTRYVNTVLDRIVARLRAWPDARLGDVRREILHGSTLDWLGGDGHADPLWTDDDRRDQGEGSGAPADRRSAA